MRDFKAHFNNKFRSDDFSVMIGLLEVKEIKWTINALALVLDLYLYFFLGFGFFQSTWIAAGFHLVISSVLALIGTIKDREYRKNKEIKENFCKTLNRLALNKTRKIYERKARF